MPAEILCYTKWGEDRLILRSHLGTYSLEYRKRKLLPATPDDLRTMSGECEVRTIAALLGIINHDGTSYIIVAKRLPSVVKYRPCEGVAVRSASSHMLHIMGIEDIEIWAMGRENKYITRVLRRHFTQPGLYCAFSKDIIETCKYKENREIYHWNRNIVPECSPLVPNLESTGCIPFVICGYLEKSDPFEIGLSTTLNVLLISRRSLMSSGKRYFQRGINVWGYASNYVETEVLVTLHDRANNVFTTFTQVTLRGSIPVCFQQTPNLSQKPPIKVVRSFPNALSIQEFSKHQQQFEAAYPDAVQVYLNLLDGKGREAILSRRLLSLCHYLASVRSLKRSIYTFTLNDDNNDGGDASSTQVTVTQVAPVTPSKPGMWAKTAESKLTSVTVHYHEINMDSLRKLRSSAGEKIGMHADKDKDEYVDTIHTQDAGQDAGNDALLSSTVQDNHSLAYPRSNVILYTPDFSYIHLDFHATISHTYRGNMCVMHTFLRSCGQQLQQCSRNASLEPRSIIYRINCLDSLDRTNTVQLCICKEFCRTVISNLMRTDTEFRRTIGTCSDISLEDLFRHLNAMFWRHGNALSIQYASTHAMKGDLSIVGRRTMRGRLKDLKIWLQRWAVCNFTDGLLQDGHLLLRASPKTPLSRRDAILHLSFPAILAFLAVYLILLAIICNMNANASAIVGAAIIFVLLAVMFVVTTICFSQWYVRWPQFNIDQYIRKSKGKSKV